MSLIRRRSRHIGSQLLAPAVVQQVTHLIMHVVTSCQTILILQEQLCKMGLCGTIGSSVWEMCRFKTVEMPLAEVRSCKVSVMLEAFSSCYALEFQTACKCSTGHCAGGRACGCQDRARERHQGLAGSPQHFWEEATLYPLYHDLKLEEKFCRKEQTISQRFEALLNYSNSASTLGLC